jgi:hypothetical protein
MLDGKSEEKKGDAPAIEEIVPPDAVPVVDGAGGDAADVAALADEGEAALVLAETVGLAEGGEGGAADAGLAVGALEGVDLLEEVEVALVAALEGLVRFLAAKDLYRALGGL